MKLYSIQTGLLHVNTYFLVGNNDNCVVIDSGENYNLISKTAKDLGVNICAILLTHGHFDHALNVKKFQDDGVKIYISEIDGKKLLNEDNLSSKFGRKFEYCKADYLFRDGEILNFDGFHVKVISTPGHTDGSVCFLTNDMLFTGDTLFFECVGRTDFVSGNRSDLLNSIKKLFSLDGDYRVFPGHDNFTTLNHEREFNFMKDYD